METTLLWIAISILFLSLCTSVYFSIKFGIMILRIQDVVEDSLDILDERYGSISQILQIPLFYDSQEVRQVLRDIEYSRESILNVARALTTIDESDSSLAIEGDEIDKKV